MQPRPSREPPRRAVASSQVPATAGTAAIHATRPSPCHATRRAGAPSRLGIPSWRLAAASRQRVARGIPLADIRRRASNGLRLQLSRTPCRRGSARNSSPSLDSRSPNACSVVGHRSDDCSRRAPCVRATAAIAYRAREFRQWRIPACSVATVRAHRSPYVRMAKLLDSVLPFTARSYGRMPPRIRHGRILPQRHYAVSWRDRKMPPFGNERASTQSIPRQGRHR